MIPRLVSMASASVCGRLRLWLLAFCVVASAWPSAASAGAGATQVTIDGAKFRINGVLTYPGTTVEGLLLNSRMVNAAFDDENPATVGNWKYPDTGRWDPERNTNEFVAALPIYAQRGLKAVTVNLQGGNPVPGCSCNATHEWITTAFRSDGTLKAAWTDRVGRIISAADQHGIVVILGLFYHGQDQRLADENAVKRAVDEAVDWLLSNGHTNVLIEVAGESNHSLTSHAIVKSRVHELIARVQQRSGGRLAASTGFTGGYVPTETVVMQSDYVLLHGNGQSIDALRAMVDQVRAMSAWRADPKPIVFNEDSTRLSNFDAVVAHAASWGYHDKGNNDYSTGFQTPPIKWTLSTSGKRAFFDRVAQYAGSSAQPSLAFDPASFALTTIAGGPVITRSASLQTSNGTQPAFTITDNAAWLSASPQAGSGPASLTVSADPAGLGPGSYTGTATATASGYVSATLTVTLTVSGQSTPGYRLMVSQSPNRSNPIELEGQTVAGAIYAFTSPDTNVDDVRFYIDDPERLKTPYRVEGNAPYDLAGGSATVATPYDTRKVPDGSHTVTAVLVSTSGSVEVLHTTFVVRNAVPRLAFSPLSAQMAATEGDASVSLEVILSAVDGSTPAVAVSEGAGWLSVTPAATAAPASLTVTADPAGLAPGTYTASVTGTSGGFAAATLAVTFTVNSSSPTTRRIVVSASPDRSGSAELEGRTTSGNIYAFTTPDTGALRVRFYVDDPARTRSPFRTENNAPFDLAGGSVATANPFDTRRLPDGSHTVTAVLDLSGGGSEVVHATFTVDN
jgi:hypothetical protein